MWIIGLLAGAIVGGLTGGADAALALGVLGAIAGALWKRLSGEKKEPAWLQTGDATRLGRLEAEVATLRREVAALRAALGGHPSAVDGSEASPRSEASPGFAASAVPVAAAAERVAGGPEVPMQDALAARPATPGASPLIFDMRLPDAAGMPPANSPVDGSVTSTPAAATADRDGAFPPVDEKPVGVAAEPRAPTLWSRLLEGNPLAKIGVVLLFFGVASALRLAVEHGLLPVPVRLFLASIAGLGLIAFGYRRVAVAVPGKPALRHFGLAIQGGGFALLYLVIYFMLQRYQMLSQLPAFALFAALGVGCVALAARQDGPMLAVFGLAGAFLAPVLAGGDARTPVPLFTYLTLINVFILVVDWFRAWRVLNIAGFLFTLAIGSLWALDRYQPEHYLAVQGFLILFVGVYSAMPVVTLLLRAPGSEAWREGILTFGVPLSGIALQSRLVDNLNYAQAWSAAIAGVYYLILWGLLYRRPDLRYEVAAPPVDAGGKPREADGKAAIFAAPDLTPTNFFERAHLGIAIAFFTLAIPLAFDAQVTSAFWAAEGCAVLWFGAVRGRTLAQGVGLAMQLAAGISFANGFDEMTRVRPVLNDFVFGGAILAIAGLLCGRLLQKHAGLRAAGPASPASDRVIRLDTIPPELPALWAGLWWFGTGLVEIEYFASRLPELAYGLLFVAASVGGLEALGVRWGWAALRHAVVLLLPAMVLAAFGGIDRGGHPLAGLLALAVPVAFGAHYVLLRRHEHARLADALPAVFLAEVRHLLAWWLAAGISGWEIAWWVERAAPSATLWPLLAWAVIGAAALTLSRAARTRAWWPWSAAPDLYRDIGEPPIALALAGWIVFAPIVHAGGGTGIPFVPVLNPLDLVALGVFAALWACARGFADARLPLALGALGFYWVTTLAGRIAHHWGGVSWNAHALWHSPLAQALVTVLWTLAAIAAMILAARRGTRPVWMGGMGLLGVVGAKLLLVDLANSGTITWTASLIGVALLLLAAGYFAPAPPARAAEDGASPDGQGGARG
jgi:uncharacterized membrane protein